MRASIGSAGKATARLWPCRSRGRRQPGAVAGLVGVAVAVAMAVPASSAAVPATSPTSHRWSRSATHARDHVRVAQRLSVLGTFPPPIIVALMSLNAISESASLAVGLAAALLAFDLLAWRVVAGIFDRERLVTGRRG